MNNWINRFLWGISIFSWCLLGAVAIFVFSGTSVESLQPEGRQTSLGTVSSFSLIDHEGNKFREKQLSGHIWVVDFIFTRCRGQCRNMTRNMDKLRNHLPNSVRFLSISVDPSFDRPDVLRDYRSEMNVNHPDWWFLTGKENEIKKLIMGSFNLAYGKAPEDSDNLLTHSNRFVLLDGKRRIRGYYRSGDEKELEQLTKDVRFLRWEQKAKDRPQQSVLGILPLAWLPEVNSMLNLLAGLLLFLGLLMIRLNRKTEHVACMISALVCSGLFLICYLTYHSYHGATPFPGTGYLRVFYFSVLLSHTILAGLLPFLVPFLLYYAITEQFSTHRTWGRWVLPIWLYVSATGVLIYLLLYRFFQAPPY